jgi:hypothetical protein
MTDTITPTPAPNRFSFAGWDIGTWLGKNKDVIKILVVFLAGYNYFAGFEWKSFAAGLIAIAGKLIIDTIDYYQSE